MNRVYNLTRLHSPLKILSPRRKQKSILQKNPSIVCLEKILKLPKINKEYKVDIIDNNFTIQYFENKKRVELTYRQRNNQDEPIAGISQINDHNERFINT